MGKTNSTNYPIIGLQLKALTNNKVPLSIIWTLFGLNRVIKDYDERMAAPPNPTHTHAKMTLVHQTNSCYTIMD